jgi:hypothetical protein
MRSKSPVTGSRAAENGPQAWKVYPWPGLSHILGFVIPASRGYIRAMPRKPLELPPEVADAFVADMRAFFAEKNPIKRDEIAIRQMSVLRQQGPGEKPVSIPDIMEMFRLMRNDL